MALFPHELLTVLPGNNAHMRYMPNENSEEMVIRESNTLYSYSPNSYDVLKLHTPMSYRPTSSTQSHDEIKQYPHMR